MSDWKAWWARLRRILTLVTLIALYLILIPSLIIFLKEGPIWSWLLVLQEWWRQIALFLPLILIVGILQQWRALQQEPSRFAARLRVEGVSYLLLPDRELAARHPLDRRDGDLWAEVATLVTANESLVVDLVKWEDQVAYLLTGLPRTARAAATQIMAHWPGCQVRTLEISDDPLQQVARDGVMGWHCHLRPTGGKRPIQPAVADPALALLSEVARLPAGVSGGLQLLISPDPYSAHALEQRAIRKSVPLLNMRNRRYEELYRQPWETTVVDRSDQRDVEEWSARASRNFLDVQLIAWATVEGNDENLARHHAETLARAVMAQYGPSNPLRISRQGAGMVSARQRKPFAGGSWTDEELGSLLHLFGREGVAVAPTLCCAVGRPLPPSSANRLTAAQVVLMPEAP